MMTVSLISTTCHKMPEGYWVPDMTKIVDSMIRFGTIESPETPKNQAILEKYEGIILVDFVPTSENIAAWLLGIAQKKLKKLWKA